MGTGMKQFCAALWLFFLSSVTPLCALHIPPEKVQIEVEVTYIKRKSCEGLFHLDLNLRQQDKLFSKCTVSMVWFKMKVCIYVYSHTLKLNSDEQLSTRQFRENKSIMHHCSSADCLCICTTS